MEIRSQRGGGAFMTKKIRAKLERWVNLMFVKHKFWRITFQHYANVKLDKRNYYRL